jgi:hypothetical protein
VWIGAAYVVRERVVVRRVCDDGAEDGRAEARPTAAAARREDAERDETALVAVGVAALGVAEVEEARLRRQLVAGERREGRVGSAGEGKGGEGGDEAHFEDEMG